MTPGPTASERLASFLKPFDLAAPPASAAGAAVLAVLRPDPKNAELEVLLIERSVREGDPGSGQVGLPGGHVHSADTTLRETALRESEEEVGIGPLDLSETPRYVRTEFARAFDLSVAIFAAPLAPHGRSADARSPLEVAGVFWMPIEQLSAVSRVERTTRHGPMQVDAALYEGHVVWGFTRRILREIFGFERAGAPPSPAIAASGEPLPR